MFLFERLFGIGCYVIILLFVFLVIYYKKMRTKDALIVYVFLLSVMAYLFEPHYTTDLFRTRQIIQTVSQYSFNDFVEIYLSNHSAPAAYCLYWVFGKLGNARLLPASVAFATYSIIFYILHKSSEIYKLKKQGTALILLFIMSTSVYMMTISGIRCMLAVAVLCLCFFRESIMRTFKWWHILLYVFSALMHNLAVILIIIRCIAFVFSARLKTAWKLIITSCFAVIAVFVVISFRWIFSDIFDKAYGYITGDTYSYIWEYVIAFLALMIEICLLTVIWRKCDAGAVETRTYLLLCVLTACIFVTQFSIFHRIITYISPILAIPLLADGFSNNPKRIILIRTVSVISLIMLCLTCVRGELSSLKFFVL